MTRRSFISNLCGIALAMGIGLKLPEIKPPDPVLSKPLQFTFSMDTEAFQKALLKIDVLRLLSAGQMCALIDTGWKESLATFKLHPA